MNKSRLAVTIGNPNGAGPEVSSKALKRFKPSELEQFIVIGNKEAIDYYFSGIRGPEYLTVEIPAKSPLSFTFKPGEKSPASGLLSYLFL
jgi:4-hydroxy-L-threonine phosphate dehydrogenase PdxA